MDEDEDEGLQEIIDEFLVESLDGLEAADADIIALDEVDEPLDCVTRLFRTVHSIKGTAGMLEFVALESVAHRTEDLMAALRDGSVGVSQEGVDLLLTAFDQLKTFVRDIQETGAERESDVQALLRDLSRLATSTAPDFETPSTAETPNETEIRNDIEIPVDGEALSRVEAPAHAPGAPAKQRIAAREGHATSKPTADVQGDLVRVKLKVLDGLADLVGELVLARNRLLITAEIVGDERVAKDAQVLQAITSELQEEVMRTRLESVAHVFAKFPRLLREVGKATGKKVRLVTEGENTELDRSLVEAIRDPLSHMVRNAVDHGIETPEARLSAGKEEVGTLRVRAFHEGGVVVIELSDDGGGIDPERIRAKAVAK